MSMHDMEGYDELMQKLLESLPPEQRVAGLTPRERLAGVPLEERLADVDRDHEALALSVELLEVLPDEYIRTLPPDVQAEIQRRLERIRD